MKDLGYIAIFALAARYPELDFIAYPNTALGFALLLANVTQIKSELKLKMHLAELPEADANGILNINMTPEDTQPLFGNRESPSGWASFFSRLCPCVSTGNAVQDPQAYLAL